MGGNSDIAIEITDEAGWSKVVHIHPLVYPPESPVTKMWAGVQWADADYRFVFRRKGEAVSHVALHIRQGLANGGPVRIAGIGGVMTHPAAQNNGYAQKLLRAALDKATELQADFCLLICEDKNVGFYEKQGWRVFAGRMIHQQYGRSLPWTLSKIMVRDHGRPAPRDGTIDLQGLPW